MNFWEFLGENWYTILSIVVAIASLMFAIIKMIKSKNTNGVLELFEMIPNLVTEAESIFGAKQGVAKLAYVLTNLRSKALDKGVKVDLTELTEQINKIVDTSSCVNVTPSSSESEVQETAEDSGNVNADEVVAVDTNYTESNQEVTQ